MRKIFLIALLLLVSNYVAAFPNWNESQYNTSLSGEVTNHSVRWRWSAATGNCWVIFELDNGNGTLQNVSKQTNLCGAVSQTPVFAFLINSTPGSMIKFRQYSNDSATPTVFNASDQKIFTATASLNISVFDEYTGSAITFNASITNGTVTRTFTNQVNGNITALPNVTGLVTITLSKTDYHSRVYSQVWTGGDNVVLQTFLVSSTDGNDALIAIKVLDSMGVPQAGVNVTLYKSPGGQLILSTTTTGDGLITTYLVQGAVYTIYLNSSTNSYSSSLTAINGNTYQYILNTNPVAPSYDQQAFQNISIYDLSPHDNIYSQFTLFQFTIKDYVGDLQHYNLTLMFTNGTVFFTTNGTAARGGNLSVNMSRTGKPNYIIAQTTHKTVSMTSELSFNYTYRIFHNINASSLPNLNIGKVRQGFPGFITTLGAVLVSIGVAAAVGPAAAFAGGVAAIFFGVMGFFALTGWVNITVVVLFVMVAAAYLYLTGRVG